MLLWVFSVAIQVIMDRSAYHYRIERSIYFQNSLSIVIDGSEMSRYGLPYFCQIDKQTAAGWKLAIALHTESFELMEHYLAPHKSWDWPASRVYVCGKMPLQVGN